jgi:glucose/arabinose dehydrogenase
MKQAIGSVFVLVWAGAVAFAESPAQQTLVTGLKNPGSVAVGPGNRIYITVAGDRGKKEDGTVQVLDKDKAVPFVTGLDDPTGLVAHGQWLFVADQQRIWRINSQGKAEVFVPADAFPMPPGHLRDIAVDAESGTLYVSDAGDPQVREGAVYRITPQGKVTLVIDTQTWPELRIPNGLVLDGASHLLVVDAVTAELHRIKLADRSHEKIASGIGGGGLAWNKFGQLFLSGGGYGKVFAIPRPGARPVVIDPGFRNAADLCLDATGSRLLVVDAAAGTVSSVSTRIPPVAIDDSPLPLETTLAFPELQWTDWKGVTERGTLVALRPIVLTHAGDGSNRVFVATQHGVIHSFPNDPRASKTKVFLDIQDRVRYADNQNEEGFLGLAFHPRFKENGEFFVFYTVKKENLVNVVTRFRLSKDDPDRADPSSEEEILRFRKPFWNHDGGTICFGPDGYLYITHGDGGAANDPHDNGQNLKSLLGKVLRIDVDRKDAGKNYAIPRDNPFVDRADALPEIWAYGLRNIWRMAFDRQTRTLWAADVGQNLWEEIDLIVKGGNYGWNRREGLHPFGAKGSGPRPDLIDPIWEYHHDIGKSITGGLVYRGKDLPELQGAYVYADYVSGKIWALRYDERLGQVVANRPINVKPMPILSFGEDEQGEVYLMTFTPTGKAIYRFTRSAVPAKP